MRKLTIKRQKSFIACLGKMKVYIEDPSSSDLAFGNASFRKLGTLKNGEEATFEIGNGEARICVIADKLTKGYCNEFLPLPAGEEDIYLSGKNHYNPTKGNPFYFDNVSDPTVLKNRKKGTMIGIAIFLGAFLLGILIGLYNAGLFESNDPKVFTYDDVQITLTEAFEEDFVDGANQAYSTDDVLCFLIKDDFSYFEDGDAMSVKEYGELLAEYNETQMIKMPNDMYGMVFREEADGYVLYYYAFVHKGKSGYWFIQFVVYEEDKAEYEQQIYDWASTFADAA